MASPPKRKKQIHKKKASPQKKKKSLPSAKQMKSMLDKMFRDWKKSS